MEKILTVSCTLLCESGDRVKVDQSSFSADLHAVMCRHHCSEYGFVQEQELSERGGGRTLQAPEFSAVPGKKRTPHGPVDPGSHR